MDRPTFSIIVLNHNKASYTRACLESLLLLNQSGDYEVVAVDNGSRDDTSRILFEGAKRFEAQGYAFQIIANETNVGAITGRNQAMEVARGQYFVFVDNDVMVKEADWLLRLKEKLEADPSVGIISPKLIFPWEPYLIECAGCGVSRTGRIQYRGRGAAREDPAFNVEREVQCLISACVMFPRKLVEEIGALDEAFSPVQYEDLDFCYRARSKGYHMLYTPEVEMYHFENTTTEGSVDINFRYVTIKNGLLFKQRWRHKFEHEEGPADDECAWKLISKKGIDEVKIEFPLETK
ncbi:MAG: glycosyltransferase family 2 protein [Armatimonadetes bacterium]|nr:glycosyltransferase family 2 protein [Armatimonadota bacterium]